MKNTISKLINPKKCKNCAHSNPVEDNLTIKTRKPILSECIYQEYQTLLNHDWCENHKDK